MSYSRSPKSIHRVKYLLDELVESNSSIEWIFNQPKKVAYYIHEAIKYSIESRKREFEKYTSLSNKYKIKVIEPDIVKAEIRDHIPNGIVIREINDVIGVIGSVIEKKQDKLIFPDFIYNEMNEDDSEILSKWCTNNTYKFYVDEHNRLTIERKI